MEARSSSGLSSSDGMGSWSVSQSRRVEGATDRGPARQARTAIGVRLHACLPVSRRRVVVVVAIESASVSRGGRRRVVVVKVEPASVSSRGRRFGRGVRSCDRPRRCDLVPVAGPAGVAGAGNCENGGSHESSSLAAGRNGA